LLRGQDSLSSVSMATSILSHPFPTTCTTFRRPTSAVNIHHYPPLLLLPPQRHRKKNHIKWAIKLSLVEQSTQKSSFDLQQLVAFLYDDLPHLFDDKGIDKSAYDERVFFRDPITKHDDLSGYLFNIALLKTIFRPQFQLHWVKPVCFSLSFSRLRVIFIDLFELIY